MSLESKLPHAMLLLSMFVSSTLSSQQSVFSQGAVARPNTPEQVRIMWEYATKIKNSDLALREGNLQAAADILEQTDIRLRGWEYGFIRHRIDVEHTQDTDFIDAQEKPAAIRTLDDVMPWHGIQLTTCVADGRQVVVVPRQGLLEQIDLQTLKAVSNFERNPSQISYLNASFDSRALVTCDRQQAVKVWNTDSLQQRQIAYSGYYGSSGPNAIAVTSEGTLVAVADQQRISIFGDDEEEPQKILAAGVGPGQPLGFSPDGRALAACSGGEVRILELATGALMRAITVSQNRISDLAWTKDGKHLLVGSTDGQASLWDASRGERVLLLEGHTKHVTSVALNKDENRILTASADGSVKVWDAITGTELLSLFDFNGPVRSARFSRDGSKMVALTDQGVLTVFSAGQAVEEQLIQKIDNPRGRILSATVSPNLRLIPGSESYTVPNAETGGKHIRGAVHVWSEQGEPLLQITPRSPVNCLTFSRDSKRLIGCHYNVIEFWNLEDGSSIRTIPGFPAEIKSIDISPDGKQIAVATAGRSRWNPEANRNEPLAPGQLSICNLSKGGEIRSVEAHESTVRQVVYANQGETLVTLGDDQKVKIWGPENMEQLFEVDYSPQGPSNIASRPAHFNEVAIARPGFVDTIDVRTGQKIRSTQCDTDTLSQLAFSPDGRQIVTTTQGQTLVLWNFNQGTELKRLKVTNSRINDIRITPFAESFLVVACTGSWNEGGELVTWQIQ
ncbi:MAG: WD40 repeat domain-containing protein [bacterium]|nr:WD40 repeat domain-containing protein [bacterium]